MREAYLKKQRKLEAKIYNERIKLKAGFLNTLGAACIISAVVFPIIREGNFSIMLTFSSWFWFLVGFMLHWVGLKFTDTLKNED